MVFKQAVRSLTGNKLRAVLSGVAVMLGVAFIAGAFVLGDMINSAFDEIFTTANRGVDVRVESIGEDDLGNPLPIPREILQQVERVDGVKVAEGGVFTDQVVIIDADGEPIGGAGPPQLGGGWVQTPELNPFTIVDGRAPEAPDEVVIDEESLDAADREIGETVRIAPNGPAEDFTIVGTTKFGDSSLGGATTALFAPEKAAQALGRPDSYDSITVVAEDDVSSSVLRDRISEVLPEGTQALTGEQAAADDSAEIKEGIGFLRNALLTFAAVALLVATVVIFNTFSITVAQRTRQLGLLRAVGASAGQVRRLVLTESLIIGVVASLIGLVVGLLVARGLLEIFNSFGASIPAGTPALKTRTIVIALGVGIIATLVAAFVPALRASRISPVAAMREGAGDSGTISRRSRILGIVLPLAGIVLLVWGLWGSLGVQSRITVIALGCLLIFVGAAVLTMQIAAPMSVVVRPVVTGIGKLPGKLALQNVVRNPSRTAASAAALTIGVALVSFFSIFSSSLTASFNDLLDRQFRADFIAFRDAGDDSFQPFSPEFADRLEALPELSVVTRWRAGDWYEPDELEAARQPGSSVGENTLSAFDPAQVEQVYDPDMVEGSISDLGPSGVLVQESAAEDRDLELGDTLEMGFLKSGVQPLRVVGIYEDATFDDFLISLDAYERNYDETGDGIVFAKIAPGVSPEAAGEAFDRVARDFPQVTAQSNQEFRDRQSEQINQLLYVIYAMLALAIIIAIFGIINTLALSVFERTREIGLLRAVGLGRGQARAMIRWESILVALLGAVVGIVIGALLAILIISRLGDDIPILDIPWIPIIVFLALAVLVGIVAALLPARRAAKLDILRAIQTE
jgi:putative ABC transport system permease protein